MDISNENRNSAEYEQKTKKQDVSSKPKITQASSNNVEDVNNLVITSKTKDKDGFYNSKMIKNNELSSSQQNLKKEDENELKNQKSTGKA